MAYAYVVRGYDDGVIAVFTNKKKAIACGINYTKSGQSEHEQGSDIEVDSRDWVTFIGNHSNGAEVEKYHINCEY